MQKIKFLIVGCGAIGERHAKLASEKGELLAVCDSDSNKAKAFSKKYNCYGYTSLKAMLAAQSTAEALIICTPNGLHAAHSIKGLKAGLHVLCEKPMALSTSDCKKMITASVKAKRHLMIVKQNRYNLPVIAVKNLLDKNKLGTVYSIQLNCFWNRNPAYYAQSNWKGTRKMDGGVLFTQFSHFIDLLYWFFGDIKMAKGFTSNLAHKNITEIEDTGVFSFITKQGVPGTLNYTTNANTKNYEGSVTVFAQKATVKVGGPYLNELSYQQPVFIQESSLQNTNKANQYKGYQGSMSNHSNVYDSFLKVIAGKQKKYTSGEEAIHSVQMIEKFYSAAKK